MPHGGNRCHARLPPDCLCRMFAGAGFSKPNYGDETQLPAGGGTRRPRLIHCGTSPLLEVRSAIFLYEPRIRGRSWMTAMTILKWALIFFLVSIVAVSSAHRRFGRISRHRQLLFYVFVVIFLVLLSWSHDLQGMRRATSPDLSPLLDLHLVRVKRQMAGDFRHRRTAFHRSRSNFQWSCVGHDAEIIRIPL